MNDCGQNYRLGLMTDVSSFVVRSSEHIECRVVIGRKLIRMIIG